MYFADKIEMTASLGFFIFIYLLPPSHFPEKFLYLSAWNTRQSDLISAWWNN
jgi:hypothetical protein